MGFPFLLSAPSIAVCDAISVMALYVYPHRLAHGECCPLIMFESFS